MSCTRELYRKPQNSTHRLFQVTVGLAWVLLIRLPSSSTSAQPSSFSDSHSVPHLLPHTRTSCCRVPLKGIQESLQSCTRTGNTGYQHLPFPLWPSHWILLSNRHLCHNYGPGSTSGHPRPFGWGRWRGDEVEIILLPLLQITLGWCSSGGAENSWRWEGGEGVWIRNSVGTYFKIPMSRPHPGETESDYPGHSMCCFLNVLWLILTSFHSSTLPVREMSIPSCPIRCCTRH